MRNLLFLLLLCYLISMSNSYANAECHGHYKGNPLQEAPLQAKEIILRIMTLANDKNNYTICTSVGIDNAFASLNGSSGKRYIIYDPIFVNNIAHQSGDDYWSKVAIFAHEIGHQVLGHLNRSPIHRRTLFNKHRAELQADEFAGKMLAHWGASLVNSQALMRALKVYDHNGISSHPKSTARVKAVSTGWRIGCQAMGNECNDPQAKLLVKKTSSPNNVLPHQHIHTQGYKDFIQWSDSLKGTLITQDYCQHYVTLAIAQANRSIQHACGYESQVSKQWSREYAPQMTWCMGASAYATEREAKFREKRLAMCVNK